MTAREPWEAAVEQIEQARPDLVAAPPSLYPDLPPALQPFPQEPVCRSPCKHADHIATLHTLLERKTDDGLGAKLRASLKVGMLDAVMMAKRIVESNSVGKHPAPHDWSKDLTLAERTLLAKDEDQLRRMFGDDAPAKRKGKKK